MGTRKSAPAPTPSPTRLQQVRVNRFRFRPDRSLGLDEIYKKSYETRVRNLDYGARVPFADRGGRTAGLRALGCPPATRPSLVRLVPLTVWHQREFSLHQEGLVLMK